MLAILIFVGLLAAQNPPATPPQQIRIGGWTVAGSLRLRFEDWNYFKARTGDNTYGYVGSLLRVGIGRQFQSQDWFFELAQPSLIALPTGAIAPAPQGQLGFGGSYFSANADQRMGVFLKQGFVRFNGVGGDAPTNLRVGRFEFGDGLETTSEGNLGVVKRDRIANRLIGNFGFTHVGRSLDGVHFSRSTPGMNLTFVGARPTEGVFQLRGMKELNVDLLYGALTKTLKGVGQSEGRIFAIYYRDHRDSLKTDNRSLALRSVDHGTIGLTTVGGNFASVFGVGGAQVDLVFWGALQTGTWGTLAHRANAAALEAGYQPQKVAFKPWLRIGYFRGSGDADASDGTNKTFFQNLPTPRPFARFPIYNLMNNEDAFLQLSFTPHPGWSVRSEVHSLRLAASGDLWYSGGGAFQKQTFGYSGRPSGGNRGFADVFDLSADYQINPQTALTFYVAGAHGRAVVRNIFPDGKNAKFGYIELTRRF